MIISIRRWKRWFQFFGLFALLTIVLYWLLALFTPYFAPNPLHQQPFGEAVKVFAQGIQEPEPFQVDEFKNRLFLFYWYGE